MPISRSHEAKRAENFRPDGLGQPPPKTGVAAPFKDASTGRFVKGNKAAKRKRLKKVAGRLGALDPATAAPWLRPWILEAREHAAKLLADLPFQTEELSAVAVELAEARAMRAALMRLASDGEGDDEARVEARHWLREARQHAIAFRGLVNQEHAARIAGRSGRAPSQVLVQGPDGRWAAQPNGTPPIGSVCRSPALSALVGRQLDGALLADDTRPPPGNAVLDASAELAATPAVEEPPIVFTAPPAKGEPS